MSALGRKRPSANVSFLAKSGHSITRLARSRTDCGILTPSALAALRLMTMSNFASPFAGPSWLQQSMAAVTSSGLEAVEAARVVGEDLPLLRIRDVAALLDLVDRAGVAVVPVGEVGRVDDLVLAAELHGLRQQPFVRLAGEVDGSAPDVLARTLAERRRFFGALGVLVVHALHPVRRPTAAGLEEGQAQAREALGDALEDDGRKLAHLAESVGAGVDLDEARKKVHAGPAEMRARGVYAQHHTEPVGLLVDGQEALVAEEVAAVGGEHPADVAQLADGAPQFERGGLGVLDRQERNGLEPGALLDELLVHERVVGAAEPHRPLAILEEAHEEAEGRVEHRQLHAALVERPQPLLGVARPVVEFVDEPPVPTVGRVQGSGQRAAAPGLVVVLRVLLVRLR